MAAVFTTTVALSAPAPAAAQSSGQNGLELQQQQRPQANGVIEQDFPQEKLESYVTAVVAVGEIVQDYMPKLQQAESQEQAQNLQQAATAEIEKAIQDTPGITVSEYQEISMAVRKDPDLMQKLQKMAPNNG